MNVAVIALISILAQDPSPESPLDVCIKTDGVQPSMCEIALAQELYKYTQAFEGCVQAHEDEKEKNSKLTEMVLTQPVPEEPASFSLFGLPDWATGILVGTVIAVGIGGGVAIGAAF